MQKYSRIPLKGTPIIGEIEINLLLDIKITESFINLKKFPEYNDVPISGTLLYLENVLNLSCRL